MADERMSPFAVVETLLRSARLARAMRDPLLAIDLYDLTARVAVRAGLAAIAAGDDRRGELEAILAPDRAFPVFTLAPQRTDWPALRAEGAGQLAAVARLVEKATDGDQIVSWSFAREACAQLSSSVAAWLPCTFVAADAHSRSGRRRSPRSTSCSRSSPCRWCWSRWRPSASARTTR
jgi:hypothetical protein